jgi:hypothetical protein
MNVLRQSASSLPGLAVLGRLAPLRYSHATHEEETHLPALDSLDGLAEGVGFEPRSRIDKA